MDENSARHKKYMVSHSRTEKEEGCMQSNPHRYWFAGVPTEYRLPRRCNTLAVDQKLQPTDATKGEDQKETQDGNADPTVYVTAKALCDGFSNFTSSHGISHVYFSTGAVKRVAWFILSVVSVVLLGVHLGYLTDTYIQFTTSTNIELVESRRLLFPAVTICNNNPIKYSVLREQNNEAIYDLIDQRWNETLEGDYEIPRFRDTYAELAEKLAVMKSSEKFALGYSRDEMFISCSFNGLKCDAKDFWRFYDVNYGNCYIFNSGNNADGPLRKSNLAGPNFGLSMEINIGLYDYIPFLTESAGVQVVLHNSSIMPFPEYNSISVSAGTQSNIAISKKVVTRLDGKYGNCTKLEQTSENMYAQPFNVSYSQWACLRTCYQKELVRKCKCFDPNLPYNRSTDVFSSLPKVKGPCRGSVISEQSCMELVEEQYAARTLRCKQCTQACSEEVYTGSLSSSAFPAKRYLSNFVKRLRNRTVQALENEYGEVNAEAVNTNILKLNVFFEMIGYTSYEQVPSYDDFQFISDIGGTFGLWIGWSVLTFFEFVWFGIDLIVYRCYKTGRC